MSNYWSFMLVVSVFFIMPKLVRWIHCHWVVTRLARRSVVHEGQDYPNNHRVIGVGYYHANVGQWFHRPWNDFREDPGYFWDGEWHAEPDQRKVPGSQPAPAEIVRANMEWRKAEADYMHAFGFGISDRRANGS